MRNKKSTYLVFFTKVILALFHIKKPIIHLMDDGANRDYYYTLN